MPRVFPQGLPKLLERDAEGICFILPMRKLGTQVGVGLMPAQGFADPPRSRSRA